MIRRFRFLSACFIVVALNFAGYGFAEINMENLAGLWLFDEGNGKKVEDISGNGNDGEFDKGPKWAKGKFGQALEFDGTAKFVIVPHNDMFNFEDDDFSIGCWMDAQNLDAYVIIKRNGGGFWAMSASIDRNTGFFIFEGGGQHIDDGKTEIVKKGWHHTVAVRRDGKISLYVDGKLETDRDVAANMDNGAFIRFGGWGSENLIGGLDEVFISKKGVAFTEEDIQTIFEKGWDKALAVSPAGKLATAWGAVKAQ